MKKLKAGKNEGPRALDNKGEIKLELGQIVITKGIADYVAENYSFYEFILDSLRRYRFYDWGDLPCEDKKMNDSAVKNNDDRIVARYNNKHGDIYIITEYNRSHTTILFTKEY